MSTSGFGGSPAPGFMSEERACAICLDRPAGVRLRPCGHNHFCQECAVQLFSCPLCRVPLVREDGLTAFATSELTTQQVQQDREAVIASRTVLTAKESQVLQWMCFGVWLFIFIGGIIEHMHNLSQGCFGGDPTPDQGGPAWLSVDEYEREEACAHCHRNDLDCAKCSPGWYNLGTQCFKYLENLPAMQTGAALGGTTYFVLIVLTQLAGIASEIMLIGRLVRRKLMPRKELLVLTCAILIEILRMFLVDIFVMQEYFGGREYSVFREPVPCTTQVEGSSWRGADGLLWCDDLTPHVDSTSYYIADRQEAWSADDEVCSTFTTASSILAYTEDGNPEIPGHERFRRMGWIIGGEFALYYFFATFINELADNMFVVPTTTSDGWLCKIFSVALEVFQLGALCPAAIFSHKACLHFTNPFGVPLDTVSTIVIVFGYFIWGFVFLTLPLAVGGFGIILIFASVVILASQLAPCFRGLSGKLKACSGRCQRCSRIAPCFDRTADVLAPCFESTADMLEKVKIAVDARLEQMKATVNKGFNGFKVVTMCLAFLPMLIGGCFLGTLVVVGQGSKKGFMQLLTAIVLLSDVLFKIIATMMTEAFDYMKHRRVRRIVEEGSNRRLQGEVIGRSLGPTSGSGNDKVGQASSSSGSSTVVAECRKKCEP